MIKLQIFKLIIKTTFHSATYPFVREFTQITALVVKIKVLENY